MATANRVDHLTDEQHRAIFECDASIALSAGAGCGKTFVLTERFLTKIAPVADHSQAELSELVAITFTDRAAREMRDRIRAKCHQRLLEAPAEESQQWLEIYRQIDSARVSTIHSFCTTLLRQYPVESCLDPNFTVLDEAEAETLLAEIIDEKLRGHLANRHEATMDLMVDYSLREIRSMLRQLIVARHSIDFTAWGSKNAEEILEIWQTFHRENSNEVATCKLTTAVEVERMKQVLDTIEPVGDVMAERCATLRVTISELGNPAQVREQLQTLYDNAKVQGGSPAKKWPNPQDHALFKTEAEALRKRVKVIQQGFDFDPEGAMAVARLGIQLLEVTQDIVDAYKLRKSVEASLDFDDLMIRARDLLTSPQHQHVRLRVANGIKHLLIDEFQDTNRLQVELVKALCDERLLEGKLFIVGDFKQSIYRFRHARPEIFRELRDDMPTAGQLSLTRNFRSQPAILDFVNALFCEPMGDAYEPLKAHRPQVSPTPAIEFLWATISEKDAGAKNKQGKVPVGTLRKQEADWIARRIRAMLDEGRPIVWDSTSEEPAARAPRIGDFALLFRALSNVEVYESALRDYGLDYYLVGGRAFYAQQEIFDLANLLRTLASEADEVSLVGALRSPFFSLSDDLLYWLAQHPAGLAAGLFDNTYRPRIDQEQRRRKQRAAEVLGELRSKKDRISITSLIQEALRLTGFDAALLAEFLGERKLANLYKLIDVARRMDAAGMFTLNDFVVQLTEFIAKQPAEPLASTLPESTDVIRLMTIHQSKGLEFPIVIIPDMERAKRADSDPAAFHPEMGPLVKAPTGTKVSTGLDLHRQVEELEGDAETMRLLYVATTRAADYLILSAGLPSVERATSSWRRLLERRFELNTGEMLGNLPPGYATPEVLVTTTRPELADTRRRPRRGADLDKVLTQVREAAGERPAPPTTIEAIKADKACRCQFSFSRLSGALQPADIAPEDSAIVGKAAPPQDAQTPVAVSDPLALGSLVHAALAQWPGLLRDGNEAAASPDHLVQLQADKLQLNDTVLIGDARDLVRAFVDGPRADSIRKARDVFTEIEFMLAWPPPETDAATSAKAGQLDPHPRWIGGVIDCLYQDESATWHLLDYKTNQMAGRSILQVADPYRMQMLLYALAIEQSLGEPLQEICLLFLRGGVEHCFEFDDSARGWLIEEVNRAMAAIVS